MLLFRLRKYFRERLRTIPVRKCTVISYRLPNSDLRSTVLFRCMTSMVASIFVHSLPSVRVSYWWTSLMMRFAPTTLRHFRLPGTLRRREDATHCCGWHRRTQCWFWFCSFYKYRWLHKPYVKLRIIAGWCQWEWRSRDHWKPSLCCNENAVSAPNQLSQNSGNSPKACSNPGSIYSRKKMAEHQSAQWALWRFHLPGPILLSPTPR